MVGGGERAVGAADRAAGQPQRLERLRAGDLVHQVEVDVEQVVRHLVGVPDLVEAASAAALSILLSPAATTARKRVSPSPGFSKWWGRSASKVTASPSARSWATPSHTRRSVPSRTSAVSRLPGSCSGGSPGPPVAAPGASVCTATSARWPGDGGRHDLVAVAAAAGPAAQALVRADHGHAIALVQAQQLGQRELQAGGDAPRHRQRRAGLPALDLAQHLSRDAGALGQIAQREVHRLAQRADAGTYMEPVGDRDGDGQDAAYVITDGRPPDPRGRRATPGSPVRRPSRSPRPATGSPAWRGCCERACRPCAG